MESLGKPATAESLKIAAHAKLELELKRQFSGLLIKRLYVLDKILDFALDFVAAQFEESPHTKNNWR